MKNILVAMLLAVGLSAAVLFAQSGNLPPAKQAIQNQYNQERTAGNQNPAPSNPNAPYPIVSPPLAFVTGITQDCDPPGQGFTIVNCWEGTLNGVQTVVYAGAQGFDFNPQQGIVAVFPQVGTIQTITTPVQAGAVQIVAAQSGVLLLVSRTGSYVLTFDVNTGMFTSSVVSPAAVVPAAQVSITTSGLAYSRANQTFTGTITIKNIGASAINAPVNIVLTGLTSGVTLANATGTFNGTPFITAQVVPTLAPGQSATASVEFANPSNGLINFSPVVYSGSFNQ